MLVSINLKHPLRVEISGYTLFCGGFLEVVDLGYSALDLLDCFSSASENSPQMQLPPATIKMAASLFIDAHFLHLTLSTKLMVKGRLLNSAVYYSLTVAINA